ncbi:MAG: uracil-DNA glycosylase, partial [Clostridia bacterium]|nr:uracil-DNA glycosylase [Deltaproteobacteria bacterium]
HVSADIMREVRAFLAFQGELGWRGTCMTVELSTPTARMDDAALVAVVARSQAPKSAAVCSHCKLAGVGDAAARLMFIAEADTHGGEPLSSKEQALLDKMIDAMGLEPSEVFIASLARCGRADDAACVAFLREHVSAVRPSAIVALGEPVTQLLLRDNAPIAELRGTWRDYEGIVVMPTYHPALLLRSPAEKRPVWEDLKNVMARLAL